MTFLHILPFLTLTFPPSSLGSFSSLLSRRTTEISFFSWLTPQYLWSTNASFDHSNLTNTDYEGLDIIYDADYHPTSQHERLSLTIIFYSLFI